MLLLYFRIMCYSCATGEGWQKVMLSCSDRENVFCSRESDDYDSYIKCTSLNQTDVSILEMCKNNPQYMVEPTCGNSLAYPYFISFFMLCSFLVCELFFTTCEHF